MKWYTLQWIGFGSLALSRKNEGVAWDSKIWQMYIQLLCYRQPKQVQRGGGHRKLTFQGFISASRPLPEVVSLSRLTCELILLLQWPNVGFFSPILAYQLSETSFCKHMIKIPWALQRRRTSRLLIGEAFLRVLWSGTTSWRIQPCGTFRVQDAGVRCWGCRTASAVSQNALGWVSCNKQNVNELALKPLHLKRDTSKSMTLNSRITARC